MRRAWFFIAFAAFLAKASSSLPPQQAVYGFDLHGRPIYSLASSPDQAVVLFFIATDCPISNRYVPEIQRLEKEFAGKPVAFWLVYPNATETLAGVVQHQAAYGLQGSTLMHPGAELMAAMHPTLTPEAAVIAPGTSSEQALRTVYLGRIDDRYVDIGRERPRATRHDLEAAITAVLAHQSIAPPGGPPIGCGIVTEAALRNR
jgi:AhpC/TSA family